VLSSICWQLFAAARPPPPAASTPGLSGRRAKGGQGRERRHSQSESDSRPSVNPYRHDFCPSYYLLRVIPPLMRPTPPAPQPRACFLFFSSGEVGSLRRCPSAPWRPSRSAARAFASGAQFVELNEHRQAGELVGSSRVSYASNSGRVLVPRCNGCNVSRRHLQQFRQHESGVRRGGGIC
jgi:hypothetical protein